MVTGRIVRVPLQGYRVHGIEHSLVRAVLSVWVRSRLGRFEEVRLRVDTASAVTTIAMSQAEELHLLVPRRAIEVSVKTATGPARQIRHPGRIRVRVPGFVGREFNWPCHFVEHQGPPPEPALGLAGVIDDLLIAVSGRYAFEARYGWLILKLQPAEV